jgi:hypothetical protein
MKPYDEPVADQTAIVPPEAEHACGRLTAACAGLAVAVLLWTFGSALHLRPSHPGAGPRATIAKLWDKHQDMARAVAAIVPAPSRRSPNPPTRIAVSCAAIRLASAGYSLAEELRPVALSPHLSQVHLRAPPAVLA